MWKNFGLIFLISHLLTSVISSKFRNNDKFYPFLGSHIKHLKVHKSYGNVKSTTRCPFQDITTGSKADVGVQTNERSNFRVTSSWSKVDGSSESKSEESKTWIPDVSWVHRTPTPNITGSGIKLNTRILEKDEAFQLCEAFRPANHRFSMERMVDVWQAFFYKKLEKVHCFKIFIKMLSDQEKQENAEKFGNFHGKVVWEKVNLEIKPSAKMTRRHFLQGDEKSDGVLNNIIILDQNPNGKLFFTEIRKKEFTTFALQTELPDQWLVHNDLLLMRDCETGGVLVFTRFPIVPSAEELIEGLKAFGETPGGEYACHRNGLLYDEESVDGDPVA